MKIMLIIPSLILGTLSLAFAVPAERAAAAKGWCGTGDPTDEEREFYSRMRTDEQLMRRDGLLHARQNASSINVETHMHLILSEAKKDTIPDETVQHQFQILVDSFAPHDIGFTLASVNRYVNDSLATGPIYDTPENTAKWDWFKTTARKGAFDVLNLFYYSDFEQDLYGFCNRPFPGYINDSHAIMIDGCNIKTGTLPGGDIEHFNNGFTTVHEVGHWFGLMHTFQLFNCDGPGDEIDDTPAESTATEGCPVGKDSCPDHPGLDPVHNYMDYSYDECLQEFTSGQRTRMHNTWNTLRHPTA